MPAVASRPLYPLVAPYDSGLLDVGDDNRIYFEVSGNPDGKPAVMVHGGPGQGSSPNMRRGFDPARYRVVLFDQRGCGRSTPHASDPATELRANTTAHLVADMEKLRLHLAIDRWLLAGGSWGSTLVLAYAEQHPERVSEIVLTQITTSRRAEIDWLYRGVARFFPEAWRRFVDAVASRSADEGDVVRAYSRAMEDPDLEERRRAAGAWCAWEDTVLSLEPDAPSATFATGTVAEQIAFVRICAHYAANGAWLEEGALLRDAGRLAGIPGVLIHGRRDLSCPIETAYALAQAWPAAQLVPLDDAGHLRSDSKRSALLEALDRFAK